MSSTMITYTGIPICLKTIFGALNSIYVAGGGTGRGDVLEDKIFKPSRKEESRVIY